MPEMGECCLSCISYCSAKLGSSGQAKLFLIAIDRDIIIYMLHELKENVDSG